MSSSAWHWPKFTEILCGTMTDRERLGLPNHYLQDSLLQNYSSIFNQMRTLSVSELLAVCTNLENQVVERVVAGNLLAVLGDPRIVVDKPEMLSIAGGVFQIGLPENEVDQVLERCADLGLDRAWIEKECPRHSVQIQDFSIAKYPVTNQEYCEFLKQTKFDEIPTSWEFRRYPIERANHPVYTITANAAFKYCQWLSLETGRQFRLPTEAEWEYAAAGPQGLEFPWGSEFESSYANTAEAGIFQSTPIGIFAAGNSPFGVADMAGNVEEYVSDLYKPYPNGKFINDHLAQIHGDYYVARGGSFARFRDLARNRRRHGQNPRSVAYAMGFRLAQTV
jgi:formylglycine-generating enzyme required for sulfatase activity